MKRWLYPFVITTAYGWALVWTVAGLPFSLVEGVLTLIARLPLLFLHLPIPGCAEKSVPRSAWLYVPWCTN